MKILFLQNTDDALGGISRVNISLMTSFAEKGDMISLISLRHSGKRDVVRYPEEIKSFVINEDKVWNCPRYSMAIHCLRRMHITEAVRIVQKRWSYDHDLKRDYGICRSKIVEIQPDIIINSHYELLDAIPEEFLYITINHFHTSFDQVLKNRSYLKIFNRYKDKIGRFVWLTEATAQNAVEAGLKNSAFIYNPLSFSSGEVTDYRQKSIIFLGRFSPEKRLDMAVRLFQEVIKENRITDWRLDIYGMGDLEEHVRRMIEENKNVFLCGSTENVPGVMLHHSLCILTSEFEGMALVILEANECGVPVVSFNFGESVYEEILDNKTGFIVEQGNEKLYKERLLQLMKDEKLREQMGRNAKDFVSRFSIERVTEDWYKLFKELSG